MNNPNSIHENDDTIDIKEVIRIIYRYRLMIIFLLVFSALVSGTYAYFKDNVYQASATVEIGLEKNSGNDMLSMAVASGNFNVATEIEIIKSRFLIHKALNNVDMSHHYYKTDKFRKIELYKESPFEVGMLKGYGIIFYFYPVDQQNYRLVVEESVDSQGKSWSYDAIHPYDTEIVTEHFHLNIVKKKEPQEEQYYFLVDNPENATTAIQQKISARQRSGSSILEISYLDNVALRAQEFINALSLAYISQSVERKTDEATRKLTFIDNQLKQITENLKGSAVKLEEFKKSSNTVNLSSKAENIIKQMSEKESSLAEMEMQQEVLNTLYKQVRSSKNLESITIVGSNAGQAALSSIVKELQESIMKKKILREDYTEMYPEVRKLKKRIAQLKILITSMLKNLITNVEEQKRLITKTLNELQKRLNKLPADERMFGQLQRKFVVNEKIYSYLLEKRNETEIIKASTVSKNRILDKALTPHFPIKPKRKMIVLIGLVLGLIVALLLAFLRDYLDDTLKDTDDITKTLDTPILGMIPSISGESNRLKVFDSPKSAVAEAYRNLRTNLQFMGQKGKAYVISVTSTVGGEGKTTVATNLSGIMSMSGKKTIVINLDMRKPTLHEKFELSNVYGMSTLLSGNKSLEEVIQHTKHDNLDIISSGPVPPNPSELIQSELMHTTIETLKKTYDVIILDTPPLGLVTDARSLMHLSDTSIYVMRAGYSKKGYLDHIKQLSTFKEIHGLGILLNDVKMGKNTYGYGYYDEER